MKKLLFYLLSLFAFNAASAFAGGYLVVDKGGPYGWKGTVKYQMDIGGLNAGIDQQKSLDLVQSIFKKWSDVSTANLTIQFDRFLDVDVTKDNARDFLRSMADGLTPIVLDRDGSIIDLLIGAGASRNVLGFAGPAVIDGKTHAILEGHAVINGSLDVGESLLGVVMLHEFGHLLGLDHTQAGIEFTGLQRDNFVLGARAFIPIMFPIVFSGGPKELQDDEILWFSSLYPGNRAGSGAVTGFVKRSSGDYFPGANVVLRGADYSPAQKKVRIYSVVSDYLIGNNGEFRFEGITPGDYELFIEPIFDEFTEGSGVGPFDSRFTKFPRDFYNGSGESGDTDADPPDARVTITVAPDAKVENLVMIANEIPNNLPTLADDDAIGFEFPNGFKFPFFGQVYDRVFVNSDGNLTFGRGEFSSTERDLARFTAGPPRIGGLFSDLNPEQAGEVLFTQRDKSVTFTWMNVPEFNSKTSLNASDGNQFSITLFSNGDVELKYGNLKVTVDQQEELIGVVGVTPGSGAVPQQVDLSQNNSLIYGTSNGIAEVFTSAIDLAGKTILFRSGSTTPVPQQRTLVIPFLQGNSEQFTAVAISNAGNSTARVRATAFGADGSTIAAVDNQVAPNAQLAKLAGELLGLSGSSSSGWIELKSDSDSVSSFYQVGGFSGKWLDGAAAAGEIGTHLYLSRVFEGAGAFQGKDAQGWLSIANPNNIQTRLVVSLYAESGLRLSRQELKVPVHGMIYDRLSNIFKDVSFPRSSGYISIQAVGGGVAAFELVRAGDTTIGITAIAPTLSSRAYSAQLGHGSSGATAFFTSLNLVNTTGFSVTVTVQAFNESHQPIGSRFTKTLGSFGSTQMDARDLFGLGDARTAPLSVGSIEVSADIPGVLGDVVFGDPSANVRFAAALPLQTELAAEASFSHVANGRLNPALAETGYFTGIAIYNPNTVPVTFTLEVFTAQGASTRSNPIVLQPGQRTSQLLSQFVPAAGVQLGGFIVLRADGGLVIQELFGNETLDFLSAVPPDISKKAELK
ncbi:MAG TPA: hypothetical protein VGK99_15630 [Acidobacteriota bacterium]|jgi:hypothetical protein